MSRRNGRLSLRITDYDDRSLLAIVLDLADDDGWVTTAELASRVFGLGGSIERQRAAMRSVAIRFAWLRRYGVVERTGGSPKDSAWRLTDAGEAFAVGRHRTTVERSVDRLDESDMLDLMMAAGDRYGTASELTRTLMRRAMQHAARR